MTPERGLARWLTAAFTRSGKQFVLRPEFQQMVEFGQQEIRREAAAGPATGSVEDLVRGP